MKGSVEKGNSSKMRKSSNLNVKKGFTTCKSLEL